MQTPLPVLNLRPGHTRPSSRTNAGRGKADGTIFAATDEIQNRNAMERIVEFPTDRTVISTENNGFAGDERDETLIDENLVETLRDLFDLELHDYYVKTYIKGSRIDYMIEAWMELHGIEFNDTNYNSVKKRLDRVRKKIYVKRHRDKEKGAGSGV